MWSLLERILTSVYNSRFGCSARDYKVGSLLCIRIPAGMILVFSLSPLVYGLLDLFCTVSNGADKFNTHPMLSLYIGAGLGCLFHIFWLWRDGTTPLAQRNNPKTGR